MEVTDFGAILVKVCVPDKDGVLTDVVLGYDDLAAYEVNGCFFGATIGRNGNRIGNSRFTLNGKEWVLEPNENENSLHSGKNGFDKTVWEVKVQGENQITFHHYSPQEEQGFPGNMDVFVTYSLTDDDTLHIRYDA